MLDLSILGYTNPHNDTLYKINSLYLKGLSAPHCEQFNKTANVVIRFECNQDSEVCIYSFSWAKSF